MLNGLFLITAIALPVHHATLSQAFSPAQRSSSSIHSPNPSVTPLSVSADDFFQGDDDIFDIEAARRQFESMVSNGGAGLVEELGTEDEAAQRLSAGPLLMSIATETDVSLPETPSLDVKIPPRPPLTSIERERRSFEIELIGLLTEGDDEVVSELYNLWFSERGSKVSQILRRADELMAAGADDQLKAESLLRSLIEEHGVHFTEPVNRLATLYYVQGRLEEALTLNKIVLSIKPWHVGALSHIVMVYAAMGDSISARQWAAFRLPSFASSGSNRKRTRWVDRAVLNATFLLDQGEKLNALAFGASDSEWIEKKQSYESKAWE